VGLGVNCTKCRGRISEADLRFKRELSEKLHPGEPFVPPKVCCECVLMAILSWKSKDEK
jgi:hypothetical protein